MIIGVDFDNTLVSYDALFHRTALEAGLIAADLPATKIAVRDHLRRANREAEWTELQGSVYGPRLAEARPFAGALDFLREGRRRGLELRLISHKTRHPHLGRRHDLLAAARDWLENNDFLAANGSALTAADLFFEPTPETKLARIAASGCDVFIDDLPEFLARSDFPSEVRRVLFDPGRLHLGAGLERVGSWAEIGRLLWPEDPTEGSKPGLGKSAGKLLDAIHQTIAGEPQALIGGANNRAYEVFDAAGGHYFLKHYFHDPADARDRFGAERAFYAYARASGVEEVPRVVGWDEANRLGLFEFVEGRKLEPAEIGEAEVRLALDFFGALNRERHGPAAKILRDVSEACFSVRQHLLMLERRVARLRQFPAKTGVDAKAAEFVRTQLVPASERVRRLLLEENAAGGNPGDSLLPDARCISPSDFGFHNSLRKPNGALVFFDFEYAGWDDPAKTHCDFFCQPSLPVPLQFFDSFGAGLAAALGVTRPEEFLRRCRALFPVYRLKWCCIMLNEFSLADRNRRNFAQGGEITESVKERQLARAQAALRRAFNT